MTLRKRTIHNSVKYIIKANSSQSEYSPKRPKPKTASLPKKQNKKNFIRNVMAEGFKGIERTTNCYF